MMVCSLTSKSIRRTLCCTTLISILAQRIVPFSRNKVINLFFYEKLIIMRYFCFTLLMLLSFQTLSAQSFDWFADNPQWEVYLTAGFAGVGLEVVTVDRDTTVGGRQAKVLARPNFLYNHISVTAQSGDSIFLWDDEDQVFHLLYDMDAPLGTTFMQPLRYSSNSITYSVVDTGSIQIGNYTLRTQTWASPSLSTEYLVVEGIGMVSVTVQGGSVLLMHFFWNEPNNSALDGEARSLCFFTSDLIRYDPTPNVDECFGLVDAFDPLSLDINIQVSPNPASTFVQFSLENDANTSYQVLLFDVLGKQVHRSQTFVDTYTMNRAGLPSGLYFYSLENEKGQRTKLDKVVFE